MRLAFAGCELNLSAHVLTRDGAEVHVEPQVFDLLVCLARADGALVSYDRLIAEVWDGRIVSDATLTARISAARAAVGDDGRRQAVIRTQPRRGVQMAVPVARLDAPPAPTPSRVTAGEARQTIRFATSRDGTGLAWAETGEGPPLLRGGHWLSHLEHDWSSAVWRPGLERLGRGRRLIRYDPRGTGLSDRRLNGVNVDKLADDMEAVADAAGLDRFPIYATSQSVPAAITLAARRPERISRMVLLNGLVQGSTARGEGHVTETMVGLIRTGWGVPGSAFMRAIATIYIPRATPEEVQSLVDMQALSASAALAAELRAAIGEIDVRDRVARIDCPVLVMHTTGDQVQDPEGSRYLARSLPRAEFRSWDSPNHALVPSDPVWGPILDEIDRFLAEEPPIPPTAGT